MKRHAGSLVLVVVSLSCFFLATLFFVPRAGAQTDKIVIPAGTPEDHDLAGHSNEPDAAKKLAMYQDFVQKYAVEPGGRGLRELADFAGLPGHG